MSETYRIWTIQLPKWRLAEQSNIYCLDITAKSAKGDNKVFAPLMNDVMRYKDGHLSEAQYTDIYLRKMRDSRKSHPDAWKSLQNEKRVAVMCYCPAGCFCHRLLFARDMKNYLESLGHIVLLEGELTKPVAKVSPPDNQPERPAREVVGFHGKEDLLSNWNNRGFTIKGVYFAHGEQFMMYCKAKLMGDHATAELILAEPDPGECKKLGRRVTPFDKPLWDARCKRIVYIGCLQKAREHSDVAEYLLSLRNKIIAEASKSDKLWGVGLAKGDPRLQDPSQWLGANGLGDVWMEVRTTLESEVVF